MSIKKDKRLILIFICVTILAVFNFSVGCFSIQTHSPIAKGTQLYLYDAETKSSIKDADIFLFTMLDAYGEAIAVCPWQEVYYRYAGHHGLPFLVPTQKHTTFSYNFVLWHKGPARCSSSVVFYRRGYQTIHWVPGQSTKVPFAKIIDFNLSKSGIGEAEVDKLFLQDDLRKKDLRSISWYPQDSLLREANRLKYVLSGPSCFRRITNFAIGEYEVVLASSDSSDLDLITRLSAKIRGLKELAREVNSN